ncbi:Ank 2 domain containing protein, partial [Asbolus verrucosus]
FFKKRTGTTDLGKDYENVFMANITLDLILDEDIKDFKQSSNNANFGAFDDVVLETESVNGHKQNYALQLKHSVRPLTANNLAEKKGDFGIKKYLEDFIKLKNDMKETVSNKFQQTFCCKGSIVTEYLKFIDNWSIREVAIHLLSPFVQSISCVTSSDKANPRSKLLREAICKFDVSIFNEQNCHRIIQVWTEIKNEFKKVDIQQINKTRSMFQITSNYTKDVEDLNDEECCKLMWLMNMCPLIVSGNKCVVKAINLCENKRFIVLGDGSFTENLHGVSVFRNLFDLKVEQDLHDKILKTFKCSLQGKEKIILKELIGQSDETENIVTTNELILMLDDSYVIGGGKEDLPESYIERSLSRHIIDDVFLEKADKNTAIIITSSKKINLNSNCYNLIQIEKFLNEKNLKENKEITKKNIYISKDNCSQEKFKTLCQKIPNMKKYHQFKIVEHNKLEWIRSNGGISDLQKFKTEDCFESEEKLFSSENNDYKTNIVCENPGMGKSTFMKNVKNKDLPSFWTVLLCPKDHSKYFRGKCCDIDEFKKYIQSKISKSPRSFESKLLKILFKEDRVSYMWDGLDETSEDNLQIVLNIIEGFAKKGLRQWITSRNNLKTSLEDKFQVFSRTIKEFNEEEQKRYIKKRLTCSEIELENVFKKIKNNMQQFKKSEILGNPLQIYMFTELFRQDPEKYNHLLENVFSLTDLYSYFIDEKFNFYYRDKENINELNENIIKRNELYKKGRIDNYAKAAMKTYFDHNVLKNLNTNCEELLAEIKKSGDPVGIITDVSEQNISNFVHNSYGEYFAALYLSKNMNMMSQFSNFIFDESCKNIRFLFDSILAQGDQALNAALYQNLSVLRSCTQFQLKHKDIGGRNALHLVCSYGQNYPHKKAKRRGIFNTVYIVNSSSFHNDDYVNKFQQENPDYKSVFEYLLNNECNPYEKDKIFNLNVFEYADKAHCLLPLLMPLSRHKNSFQNIKNFSVPVILHYAAVFNFPTVFDMVGSKNIPLIYNADDESLLVIAARNNSLGTLKKLIDTKNYKTIFKKEQELLINLSCQEGHYEIVKLLIERGASVDSENKYGNRPLHLACQEGHYEI